MEMGHWPKNNPRPRTWHQKRGGFGDGNLFAKGASHLKIQETTVGSTCKLHRNLTGRNESVDREMAMFIRW